MWLAGADTLLAHESLSRIFDSWLSCNQETPSFSTAQTRPASPKTSLDRLGPPPKLETTVPLHWRYLQQGQKQDKQRQYRAGRRKTLHICNSNSFGD